MKLGAKNYQDKIDSNKDIEKKFKQYKYHLGWGTFIFICLCFIAITLIGIYGTKPPLSIFNSLIISSVVTFCLNLLWWISRQRFSMKTKWKLSTYYKKLKLDNLIYFSKERKDSYAFSHIDSFDDYNIYYDEKIKNSRIAFLVSFSIFSLLLLAIIIASFFVK